MCSGCSESSCRCSGCCRFSCGLGPGRETTLGEPHEPADAGCRTSESRRGRSRDRTGAVVVVVVAAVQLERVAAGASGGRRSRLIRSTAGQGRRSQPWTQVSSWHLESIRRLASRRACACAGGPGDEVPALGAEPVRKEGAEGPDASDGGGDGAAVDDVAAAAAAVAAEAVASTTWSRGHHFDSWTG